MPTPNPSDGRIEKGTFWRCTRTTSPSCYRKDSLIEVTAIEATPSEIEQRICLRFISGSCPHNEIPGYPIHFHNLGRGMFLENFLPLESSRALQLLSTLESPEECP